MHREIKIHSHPMNDLDWVAAHVATANNSNLRLGAGPPLPPINSNITGTSSSLSGSEDHGDDHRTADALVPHKRPVSANKKFLAKYNLDRHNLFAPT